MAIQPPHPELLAHGVIPAPMHGTNPRTILGDEWWQEQRRAAAKEYRWHCWACGVHKLKARFHQWLEGHERYDIDYDAGRLLYLGCCALCHACHNYIHVGRLRILVEEGAEPPGKLVEVIEHGNGVVEAHGVTVPDVDEDAGPCWEDWRMEIGGALYRPRFRSREDWARHYGEAVDANAG